MLTPSRWVFKKHPCGSAGEQLEQPQQVALSVRHQRRRGARKLPRRHYRQGQPPISPPSPNLPVWESTGVSICQRKKQPAWALAGVGSDQRGQWHTAGRRIQPVWALAGVGSNQCGPWPGVKCNQRGPWPAWEATSVCIDRRAKQPAWVMADVTRVGISRRGMQQA